MPNGRQAFPILSGLVDSVRFPSLILMALFIPELYLLSRCPSPVLFKAHDGFYTLFRHYIPTFSYACTETLISGRVLWAHNKPPSRMRPLFPKMAGDSDIPKKAGAAGVGPF